MGGSIAFEMAQQLRKAGQGVSLVAMFDSYNYNGIWPLQSVLDRVVYRAQKTEFHLSNVLRLAPKDWPGYLVDKLKGAREREFERFALALSNLLRVLGFGNGKKKVLLEEVNERAGIAYKPNVYQGKITLFQPRKNYRFRQRQQMSWEGVAGGGMDVIELPVSPGGLFVEPYVGMLAARLRISLKEANLSG
jgi:thioesterase domain-containing protein